MSMSQKSESSVAECLSYLAKVTEPVVLEPGFEPLCSASRAQDLNLYTKGQVGQE